MSLEEISKMGSEEAYGILERMSQQQLTRLKAQARDKLHGLPSGRQRADTMAALKAISAQLVTHEECGRNGG